MNGRRTLLWHFTAHIRNRNTRWSFTTKAALLVFGLARGWGLLDLGDVKPPQVAANGEMLGKPKPKGQELSKPSVKHNLAALGCAGQNIPRRKARRRYSTRDEARALLAVVDPGSVTGLRGRVLPIGVMIYTFARLVP